jgi:glycosyltransferase involved in cell wall biosynthesis
MRVLALGNMYPPHHLGGYELCWQGANEELRSRGHQVRVLTTDYRRPEAGTRTDEPGVHRELRWYWKDHEWLSMDVPSRLRLERHNAAIFDGHVRDFQPDLISWWAMGGMSLGLIERARRAGLPAVLFIHDYWPSYGPEHDLWTRMWRWRPRAAAVVDRLTGLPTRPKPAEAGRWLFNSRSMRDEIAATGAAPPDNGIVSPGIDRTYLDTPKEPEPDAWQWRLLYLGRVVEQKGVRTAIESLAMLPAESRLQIVGEGDPAYRDELGRVADELGVTARVEFEAPLAREELFARYRSCDVVVFPVQWAEPWGLVPLEAMALGRPVVATGRGGSADYLADRGNSLMFDAGDAAGLARAIRELAADADLRRRLRAQGYETAARHTAAEFDRGAADEMEAALRRALTKAPPRNR